MQVKLASILKPPELGLQACATNLASRFCFLKITTFQKLSFQWFTVLAALAEDLGAILSTHVVAHNHL